MANTDRAYGFVAFGPLLRQSSYSVDASNGTAIFIGDLVIAEADGNCAPAAATNTTVLGPSTSYIAASTATSDANPLMVMDNTQQLYMAQDDGTEAAAQLELFQAFDHLAEAGSTTTLISGHQIDISSGATSGQLLKALDFVKRPDNDGALANADWVCQLNVGEGLLTVSGGV
jgi:hypothetical protein